MNSNGYEYVKTEERLKVYYFSRFGDVECPGDLQIFPHFLMGYLKEESTVTANKYSQSKAFIKIEIDRLSGNVDQCSEEPM